MMNIYRAMGAVLTLGMVLSPLLLMASEAHAPAKPESHAVKPVAVAKEAAKPDAHAAKPEAAKSGHAAKPEPEKKAAADAHATGSEKVLPPSMKPLAPLVQVEHPTRRAIPSHRFSKPAAHPKKAAVPRRHVPVAMDSHSRSLVLAQAMAVKLHKGLAAAHAPYAVLLSCADTPRNRVLGNNKNSAYSVENYGNQMVLGEPAVSYAVRQLHSPVLMIVAREDCRAVDRARSDFSALPASERNMLLPLMIDKDMPLSQAQLQNLDQQVDAAVMQYGGEIESGRLAVLGVYYDISGSQGQGKGQLVLTNVNGETSKKAITELLKNGNMFNAATGMLSLRGELASHAMTKPAVAKPVVSSGH